MLSDPLILLLLLAVGLPLLAAALTWVMGRSLGEQAHLVPIAGVGAALVASVLLFLASMWLTSSSPVVHGPGGAEVAVSPETVTFGTEKYVTLWTWLQTEAVGDTPALVLDVSLRIDPLTVTMLLIVNAIGLLVVVYSIGYMHDDPGYGRYFATLCLFVFAMNLLVSASNLLVLYCGWEGVGLCSYLLIGFWFRKPEAQAAARKAFMLIRIGDVAFVVAIFLIWIYTGTINFHDTLAVDGSLIQAGLFGQTVLGQTFQSDNPSLLGLTPSLCVTVALLLFVAACAKSAQFPLHTWLPDAMEGPTPASALIHAATMVTAGVYLVARTLPLFAIASEAGQVVSIIGATTALLAALIALTQTDLKRVLAYSTISQLGFMFMALGTATALGTAAAMFHLMTHALFKALLFLGAGSVMHAMGGVIDMNRFGGLRKIMPTTHWTFVIGALALAGVPPLAGFFSKDEILVSLYEKGEILGENGGQLFFIIFGVAVFSACLTAAYTARAYFMTFWGTYEVPEEAGHHAHESPPIMTIPLVILAIGTVIAGAAWEPLSAFLYQTPSLAWALSAHVIPHPTGSEAQTAAMLAQAHATAVGSSVVAVMIGLGVVAFLYLQDRKELSYLTNTRSMQGLQQISYNRFYLDEIYTILIMWPALALSKIASWLDGAVVDGVVGLVAGVPRWFGNTIRFSGSGLVPFYALAMAVGLLILIVAGGVLP
jgi:NADH-quinone oxidoreductase subunit L